MLPAHTGLGRSIPMHTILGASGSIANALVPLLAERQLPVRLVSRHPASIAGAETRTADLTHQQQTIDAVAGSSIVYLLAGLKYDHKLWAQAWPRIIDNAIEACQRAGARLIFFDNVYMYGRVNGLITEQTPHNPCSKKGEVRATIAATLERAWQSGSITALIARSADFYGPDAKNGLPNAMVFDPMRQGKTPMCLVSDAMPHSYTYVPDAAQALLTLAQSASAWNQVWHLPTAPQPLTGREFIDAAAKAMHRPAKCRVLSRPMVKIVGWFDPLVREVYEMLYQNDAPYLFDSSKYATAFGYTGTSYAEGIVATAAACKATS
jgi:nucleoside-diphosphate-sugar epimerase